MLRNSPRNMAVHIRAFLSAPRQQQFLFNVSVGGRTHRIPCSQKQRQLWRGRCAVSSTETEAPPSASVEVISKVDLRVGRVLKVDIHPEATELFVEEVDLGGPETRTIVSGLRKFVSPSELQGELVVVVSNLKPRKMRGVVSEGMLLCASNADHSVVEPLRLKDGTPGERITFAGYANEEPASPNQVQKKKLWELCQPHLKTDEAGVANFQGAVMMASSGPLTSGIQSASLS